MKYFSNFPYILYTFPDGVERSINDISRTTEVSDDFFEYATNLETYTIKEGETPEIVAFKFYNDPGLHWMILKANRISNVYTQWPKTTDQFDTYLREKYGTQKTALNDSEVVLNDEDYQSFIEFVGLPDSDFASKIQIDSTDYITLRPHHFEDVDGTVYSYDSIISDSDFKDGFGNVYIRPSALDVTPVSIYDYEVDLNEAKKNILIPSSEFVDDFIKQLRDSVNE
jgi:hypothetical protein